MIDPEIAAQVMGSSPSPSTASGIAIDPEIAAAVLGAPKPQKSSGVSPFMSGVAGFDKQVENIPANIASLGAAGLDKLGLTNNAQQSVDNFYKKGAQEYQQDINQNPTAGAIGEGVGSIAASAPIYAATGGTLPGLAAAGAMSGYLGTGVDSNKSQDVALGIGLSVAIPPAVQMVGKSVGSIVRSIKPALATPSDLAAIATQKTLDQVGGNLSKATPEQFFNNVDNLTKAAKIRKDELYNSRNALADSEGVGVNRTNLGNVINNLQEEIKTGATTETRTALEEVKNLIGDGSQISYAKAQSLVSDIGKKINSAYRSGNEALANKLSPIKQALLADIENGGGSDAIKSAHIDANDFYSNVYAPLRDLKTRKILAENYADGKFVDSAIYSITGKPLARDAFRAANARGLENNAEQMMQAAHINALREAATDTNGVINPKVYANSLAKTLKDNPTPFAPIADKLQALGNALEVAKNMQGLRADLSQHSLGQKIGMGAIAGTAGYAAGGPVTAALTAGASYILPKAKYLYAAGNLLKNPQTAALLDMGSKIKPTTDPNVVKAINSQISSAFDKQLSTIPARLAPLFSGSASEEYK
jgi:hypothetical protein